MGVEQVLLVLPLDRLALAVDHGVGRHDAVGGRVGLDHLELDGPHAAPDDEVVPLVDGPVGLQEVGLQVHLEPVAGGRGPSFRT